MENHGNTTITKIIIDDKKFYIKLNWKGNDADLFHLQIYDGNRCWMGRYSHAFAERYMEKLEESQEEYYENVKAALMNNTGGFVYEFIVDPDSTKPATFKWKKKLEEFGTLVHGSMPVYEELSTETKTALIETLIQENQELRHRANDYQKNTKLLEEELKECKADLEKFVNLKISLEMSVYGKFTQLLNSKKKRIRLLEQNLYDLQDDTELNSEMD